MSKCVVCTVMNTIDEKRVRPSVVLSSLQSALQRRWSDTPKSEKRKYCRFHGSKGSTGRATWPEAKTRIPQLLANDKAEAE